MHRGLTEPAESGLNPGPVLLQRKGSALGILDSLENSPAFKGALSQLEGAVLPVVLSEVLGNNSQYNKYYLMLLLSLFISYHKNWNVLVYYYFMMLFILSYDIIFYYYLSFYFTAIVVSVMGG